MGNKILVTDSLFIFDKHVKQLENAGFTVERLDKPSATEEELREAIKGKAGYILGGVERVTAKVFDAANELKALAFTGADYEFYIPGWQRAQELGIAIANTPGANQHAVSEFAVGMALAMQRNLFELGRTGSKTFETTGSLKDAVVGVVGAGRIGSRILKIVEAFEPQKVIYTSRTKKDIEAEFVSLEELAITSDVIFIAVPDSAGMLFNADLIDRLKDKALVVSVSSTGLFDLDALLKRLQAGTIRAAIDWPAPSKEFEELPLGTWFNSNDHTAYNTRQANLLASDMATQSMINLLKTGKDKYKVV